MNGVATMASIVIDAIGKVADAVRRKDEAAALSECARANRMAQAWRVVVEHYKGAADAARTESNNRLIEIKELQQRVADLERLAEILNGGPQS